MKTRLDSSSPLRRVSGLIALGIVAFGPVVARADVKLPAVISDHMVAQSEAALPIWGWADPGEDVTVTIAGQSRPTKAGADGKWLVKLDKLTPTNVPQTLTVKGKNTLTVKDVLVGEVWLASGQSNMAFQVNRGQNAEQEKGLANYPQLRMFTVQRAPKRTPQADCAGTWVLCSPDTVGTFSAVAYFFGRELHQKLAVPVGLINSSVGGTDIAAWTSEDVQMSIPALKDQLAEWTKKDAAYDAAAARATLDKQLAVWKEKAQQAKAAGKTAPAKPRLAAQPSLDANCPANLYNGMIAPLIPYALRGAIWYQGEHNTSTEARARLYSVQLPLLVADWRTRWGADFPFAWVQLPNFDRKDFRPLVREAMLNSLSLKNTGMAVTTDIGEPNDNHPKNKQEVGHRLALWALGTVYGQSVPATSGPLPQGHRIRDHDVVLRFQHTAGGLVARGGELKGFVIAGADQQWKPASATIEGNTVVVSNASVVQPVAVRYAWDSNPNGNLYNGAGLPATPFRTDDWK